MDLNEKLKQLDEIKQTGKRLRIEKEVLKTPNPLPNKIKSVEPVQLIKVVWLKGKGTEDDLLREAVQYWDLNGNFIKEIDDID